jgi:predicted PurR-regulated permease PerM
MAPLPSSTLHLRPVRTGVPRWVYLPISILGWLGVAVISIWLASHVVHTLLLVVLASLIAFALYPAVGLLAHIIPRFLALLIVYVVVLGLVGTLIYFVITAAIQEAASLIQHLQQALMPGSTGQSTLVTTLEQLGLSPDQINTLGQQALHQLEGLAGNVFPAVLGILTTAIDVVVIIVLSVYLVISGGQVRGLLAQQLPLDQRERILFVADTVERVAGGYIRGQILLSAITATLVTGTLFAFQVPYAILLGVLTFALDFIPVLGSIVSGAISVLVALSVGWPIALGMLGAFVAIHVLDGYVLGPRIVGRALGVNPITIFIALLAGAELFGMWGALLAAPLIGAVQAIVVATWREWRTTHPEQFPIVAESPAVVTEGATTSDVIVPPTPELP